MSIIVVGAGEVGYHVARRLSLEKKDVTVIDKDIDKIKKVQDNLDVQVIHGIGSSLKILKQAGIDEADMVVAVTDSDEVNIVSCLAASTQARIPTKVARIRNLEYVDNPELLSKGNVLIDLIINPESETVSSIIKLLQVPGATDVVDFVNGKVRLIGYTAENPIFRTESN
jgi:trk system potassium uptake protein TrkA